MQISAWLLTINFHLLPIGCKLWLKLIQNHARHHFPASEHVQCCLFRSAALHSILFCNMLICCYALVLVRDQQMIERLSIAMRTAWVCNKLLQTERKID